MYDVKECFLPNEVFEKLDKKTQIIVLFPPRFQKAVEEMINSIETKNEIIKALIEENKILKEQLEKSNLILKIEDESKNLGYNILENSEIGLNYIEFYDLITKKLVLSINLKKLLKEVQVNIPNLLNDIISETDVGKKQTVTKAYLNDWYFVFVDGKECFSNDSFEYERIFETLGVEYNSYDIMDEVTNPLFKNNEQAVCDALSGNFETPEMLDSEIKSINDGLFDDWYKEWFGEENDN